MNKLQIFTDGACSGNGQKKNAPGGWGAVLIYGDHKKEIYGGEISTTNNRMEIIALIQSLKQLKKDNLSADIFSDSAYLINCFKNKWYISWKKNGWITSSKTPVLNRELWEELIELVGNHNLTFYKVKGHVDLSRGSSGINTVYKKFLENNSVEISRDTFLFITEMNNRADELANLGMEQYKKEQ